MSLFAGADGSPLIFLPARTGGRLMCPLNGGEGILCGPRKRPGAETGARGGTAMPERTPLGSQKGVAIVFVVGLE